MPELSKLFPSFPGHIASSIRTSCICLAAIILYVAVSAILIDVAISTSYYVSTSGSDSNSGLTKSEAWRTITYAGANVKAGDIVYIKGGNYTREYVAIMHSGTAVTPIILEGYDGTPLLDGLDRSGVGITILSRRYIELRNIEVTRYKVGVYLNHASNMTLDNITASRLGKDDGDLPNGYGVWKYGLNGYGIYLVDSEGCVVRGCTVTDAIAANFALIRSNYTLLDRCRSYGADVVSPVNYYMILSESHDNIIKNCTTKNMHAFSEVHPGHGIGLKHDNYRNKIIDCETYGNGECFFASLYSHDNEFINCTAYGDGLNRSIYWSYGLVARDGSYRNIFEKCRTVGVRQGAVLEDTSETIEDTIQHNNVFSNCIFDATDNEIYIANARNTTFKSCIFTGADNLISAMNERDNVIKNSIIMGIKELGESNISITYSDFWDNAFSMPRGDGNINKDVQKY